jgi:hypothetical protein
MHKVRLAIVGVVAALAAGAPSAHAAYDYVSYSTANGVYRVNAKIPNQPLFGAWYDSNENEFCIGVSLQLWQCRDVPPVDGLDLTQAPDAQYVRVDTDTSDDGQMGVFTSVPGQPLVSVWYSTRTGKWCVDISQMVPQCLHVPTD